MTNMDEHGRTISDEEGEDFGTSMHLVSKTRRMKIANTYSILYHHYINPLSSEEVFFQRTYCLRDFFTGRILSAYHIKKK